MSDSIKNKLLEKALDEVFNLVIGKSKEELIEIIFKDDMKKTLYKVMKEFSQSEHYKYVFSEYVFLDEYCYMSSFDEEMFSLNLGFRELEENIKKVVIAYFNSDSSDKMEQLIEIINNKFIEKASLKVNLADLLIKQEKLYSNTIKQLDKQMEILNELKNQKYDEEDYRRNLMKRELNPVILSILNDISNRYCHLVLKKSPQLDRNMDLYITLQDVLKNIDDNVKDDFFKKPIRIVEASPDIIQKFLNGNKSIYKDVEYKIFIYNYFKVPILKKIDELNSQYSNQLTKTFIENLIKLKSQLNSGFMMSGLEYGVTIDSKDVIFNVLELRAFLREFGVNIKKLFKEIKEI